jgi:hypothetical protein
VVVCGTTAILIECKLATCRSKTRYSGDYKEMKEFLEERLVKDKGVSQLLTAVDHLTTMNANQLPSCVAKIRKFIPVIITKDDVGSSWYVNAYLNARFEEGRKKYKGYTVTPLVSISLGTLERCMNSISKREFSVILEDRIQNNKELTWTFEAASSFVGPGTARNIPSHLKVMNELIAELITEFKIHD